MYGTGVQYTTTCELVGRLGWCALERFQFVDTAAPIRGTGGCSVPGPDKNGHGAARCAQPILYKGVRTCLARGAVCCCGLHRPLPHYSSPSGPEEVSIQRSSLTSTCALPVFWSARLMCHRTTVAASPPSRRHSARTFLSYKAGSACSGISNSRSTS